MNWRAKVRREDFHRRVDSLPGEIRDASALHKEGQAAIALGNGFHRRQCIAETQAGHYLRLTVGPVQRPQRVKGGALVFQRPAIMGSRDFFMSMRPPRLTSPKAKVGTYKEYR